MGVHGHTCTQDVGNRTEGLTCPIYRCQLSVCPSSNGVYLVLSWPWIREMQWVAMDKKSKRDDQISPHWGKSMVFPSYLVLNTLGKGKFLYGLDPGAGRIYVTGAWGQTCLWRVLRYG